MSALGLCPLNLRFPACIPPLSGARAEGLFGASGVRLGEERER
jgi:hypothetical protein